MAVRTMVSGQKVDLRMACILIVEDDELQRDMLQSALERKGHQVITASDGRQGLAQLSAQAFDLVLTDLFMPHTDGVELLRAMNAQGCRVPVIAMTGGINGIHRPFTRSMTVLGARAVLSKPFSTDELLIAIDSLLGDAPSQGATDTSFV